MRAGTVACPPVSSRSRACSHNRYPAVRIQWVERGGWERRKGVYCTYRYVLRLPLEAGRVRHMHRQNQRRTAAWACLSLLAFLLQHHLLYPPWWLLSNLCLPRARSGICLPASSGARQSVRSVSWAAVHTLRCQVIRPRLPDDRRASSSVAGWCWWPVVLTACRWASWRP